MIDAGDDLNNYIFTTEKGLHLIIITEEIKNFQNTLELYSILSRSILERNGKKYNDYK